MKNFTAVILAAGKGKRMRLASPKVLEVLAGRPLIYYVLRELFKLKKYIKQIIIVVGHEGKKVKEEVEKYFSTQDLALPSKVEIKFIYQVKILGTAKALQVVTPAIKYNNVLVVCGDTPLITSQTLSRFIAFYLRKKISACVLTTILKGKNTLGIIVRDEKGKLRAIKEKAVIAKRTTYTQPLAEEINSGIYCFRRPALLKYLFKIKKNPKKKEYFLTDIVEIISKEGEEVESYFLDNSDEALGINTQKDLYVVESIMRERILDKLMKKGVRIIDPKTTFIDEGVKIGRNSVIYPFTFVEKDVIIGNNCSLGPFIHLRKGTSIKDNTHLGNFVEINRSRIGQRVKMGHFGYIGDAVVEDGVNIGAGTVTANFDGKKKWKTYIKKGSFIGSDTILVAPVKVGKGGVTGAGSVVTKDVKSNTVVAGVPARILKRKKG